MATQDGYAPYPINLTAKQSVDAIHRAHKLPETLAQYSHIAQTDTPPTYEDIETSGEFWFNTTNGKVYRAFKNDDDQVLVWFEV